MPPREVIERLAESSAGDVRSAVNALQFTCLCGESLVVVVYTAHSHTIHAHSQHTLTPHTHIYTPICVYT